MEFIALDKEHYWTLGSVQTVSRPNGQEENMREFLSSAGLQRDLDNALDIIVIGAASCEFEDPLNPDEAKEERRAETRAEELTSWLREVLPNPKSALYSINLGRFRLGPPDCPQNDPFATRMQRGAFLVSVHQKSPAISSRQDLAQLLKRHLSEKENCLGIELGKYSRGNTFEMVLRKGPS